MTNKINFTKKGLEALALPEKGKRGVYHDTKVAGLNIIITDKGSKSFYVRKVIDGISKRIRLGAFPDLSVENARNMAMEVKSAIAQGKDPHAEKQKKKLEPTLSDFFQIYINRYAKLHKKSYKSDIQTFNRYVVDTIGKKKLSIINQHDIRNLHHDIGDKGKYAANRTLALLRTIYNKSIEWGVLTQENPVIHVKPFKEKSRDRFLQRDELQRFFQALEAERNRDISDYVIISLFTGARRMNVLSMKWQDISLEQHEWRIPETKNGEPITIHLVEKVIDILQQRYPFHGGTKFVFPSSSKAGHLVEPKTGWKRILERAEITDLRLHDLRRTFGSYMAINGTSLQIIGKALGHQSLAATSIYSKLDRNPVNSATDNATNLMLEIIKKGT